MSQANAGVPGTLIRLPLRCLRAIRPFHFEMVKIQNKTFFVSFPRFSEGSLQPTPPILRIAVAPNDCALHAHPSTRSCVTKRLFWSIAGAPCGRKHLCQRRLQLRHRGLGGAFQGTFLGDCVAPLGYLHPRVVERVAACHS